MISRYELEVRCLILDLACAQIMRRRRAAIARAGVRSNG